LCLKLFFDRKSPDYAGLFFDRQIFLTGTSHNFIAHKKVPVLRMSKKSGRKKTQSAPLQFVQEKPARSMYRIVAFIIWVVGIGIIIWKYGKF